jgi:hypothetical protein
MGHLGADLLDTAGDYTQLLSVPAGSAAMRPLWLAAAALAADGERNPGSPR